VPATYHAHTFRCQHATGDVIDYARAALAARHDAFGITDHSPLPDGRWADVRMRLDQLPDYEAAVEHARFELPELKILMGMECDVGEAPEDFFRAYLEQRGYDYLIASTHYVDDGSGPVSAFEHCTGVRRLADYAKRTVAAIDSGLYAFIAHPDVFGCCNPTWNRDCAAATRDICTAAAACGVPLELNSLGLRRGLIDTPAGQRARYPWRPFWEVASDHGCLVVINSDAHRPEDVNNGLNTLARMAQQLRLEVIDPFAEG
jgi:histidinol-phosphatase (PHP family)